MATSVSGAQVDTDYLQGFAEAWNRHDLEDLMSYMDEDCLFQLSSGPGVDGTRYEGYEAVREGYAKLLEMFPDGQWTNPHHFVAGERGVTQWTFVATMPDGSRAEVDGCDLFTFRNGKIAVKNSFRKNRIV